MTPTSVRHRCPGRCGRSLRAGRLACTRCTARMPAEIRADLAALTTHGGRQMAATEARDWLLANPAPADPDAKIAGECEYCDQPLLWLTTAKGARMPVDADPDPDRGNVIRDGDVAGQLGPTHAEAARAAGVKLWLPHVVTCPHRDRHADRPKRKPSRR